MEGYIGLFVLIHSYPDHMSLRHLYKVTLASVADPRLFDPRVADNAYILTMSMQQTSVHGRTISRPPPDKLGRQNLGLSFTFVRVQYLTTVEYKKFLPGSPLSHLYYRSKNFCHVHCGYYYLNGTPALRSLIYVDVGVSTSHPCS